MKRIFKVNKNKSRKIRHNRVRAQISGTAIRPRLSVFRGLRNLNLQLIDDESRKTIVSINTNKIKDGDAKDRVGKVAKAYLAGLEIAKFAIEKKIEVIVFDRGGYQYHGRVKAAADGAREGGLKF